MVVTALPLAGLQLGVSWDHLKQWLKRSSTERHGSPSEHTSALSPLGGARMSKESRRQRVTTNVAIVIVLCWVINFGLDISVNTYDPPGYIQPLMLIVAGWLFSDSVITKKRNGNNERE